MVLNNFFHPTVSNVSISQFDKVSLIGAILAQS